jgi:hypothetical protein
MKISSAKYLTSVSRLAHEYLSTLQGGDDDEDDDSSDEEERNQNISQRLQKERLEKQGKYVRYVYRIVHNLWSHFIQRGRINISRITTRRFRTNYLLWSRCMSSLFMKPHGFIV